MRKRLKNIITDETAATSIEYALISSFISIVIVGGATSIGSQLDAYFTTVASAFGG
jgi:pilus assembly protein Flp/PilA